MRSWLSLTIFLVACGTDVRPRSEDVDPNSPIADTCDQSYLDYGNFGEPFVLNWCRGCHSSTIPMAQRQKAPMTVNFDTLDDVQNWSERIEALATTDTPTMPPAGGPSAAERALLKEWIECGTR